MQDLRYQRDYDPSYTRTKEGHVDKDPFKVKSYTPASQKTFDELTYKEGRTLYKSVYDPSYKKNLKLKLLDSDSEEPTARSVIDRLRRLNKLRQKEGNDREDDRLDNDPDDDPSDPDDDGDEHDGGFWLDDEKPLPRGFVPCTDSANEIVRRWNEDTENGTYVVDDRVVKLMNELNVYLARCPPWAYGRKYDSSIAFTNSRYQPIVFPVDEDGRYRLPVQREVLGQEIREVLQQIEVNGSATLSEYALLCPRAETRPRKIYLAQHTVATLAYEGYSTQDSITVREDWTKESIDLGRHLDVRTSLLWLIEPSKWLNPTETSFSPLIYAIRSRDARTPVGRRCLREANRIGLENRVDEKLLSPIQIIAMNWEDNFRNRTFMYELIDKGADINYYGDRVRKLPAIGHAVFSGKIEMAGALAMHGANPLLFEKRMSLFRHEIDSKKIADIKTAFVVAKADYENWMNEQSGAHSAEKKRPSIWEDGDDIGMLPYTKLPEKRGRGRPKKRRPQGVGRPKNPSLFEEASGASEEAQEEAPKKNRGRPRKRSSEQPEPQPEGPKRGRGRPKSVVEEDESLVAASSSTSIEEENAPKRKRGRPRKNPLPEQAESSSTQEDLPERKRGRPPKGSRKRIRDQIALRSYFRAHEKGNSNGARFIAARIPEHYHVHMQRAHKLFATN